MQVAHNLAQEELRKAYPDLNDREASKKFFGYESWAINPLELSSVPSGENDGKVYDANHKEVSSERKQLELIHPLLWTTIHHQKTPQYQGSKPNFPCLVRGI